MESAVQANDPAALTAYLASPAASPDAPRAALHLAARQASPALFNHLLATDPALTASFQDQSLLYAAIDGASIPIWETMLAHRPNAKNQRFGHHGTVLEMCVKDDRAELLEYLLQQGARVESEERPILMRAEICGASDQIKQILRKYGAKENYEEDEGTL